MASLETGRLLGDRYQLQDRLGDGGHAEVWKARDTRGGRVVALKFLHLRGGGANDALPVLQHEANMAQRLDHPGVLKLDDPQQDGSFVFLPMELATGGDASWLRGAPWQRVLPVLLQAARVLEHAHGRGVVHRDLKARNVLFNTLGNVLLSDFGTAASTGSSDAPASGSPFSASPQQLRDEPAATADDVYGLGALAHELLTRYPPFYPNFDRRRVQQEDPPRPLPVHPAPEALLDLVQAMLSRDAAARPDLATIIRAFEGLLVAGESTPAVDATLVNEPALVPGVTAKRGGPWLRSGLPWMLGILAIGGIAALLWSPHPAPTAVAMASTVPIPEAPPQRVADAVLSAQPAAPVRPATPLPESSLQEALRAGQAALLAMQPEQARAAFQHALLLQPEQAQARQGLAASEQLATQLAALADGARLEARGDLPAAADRYRELLTGRAAFAPARAALARVEQHLGDQKLEDLLNTGADALRHGHVPVAQSAYRQAAEIAAGDSRVIEGQQRVAEVLTNQRNATDLASGAQLEDAEQWDNALALYREVLARDASLRFAADGLARSERRAALDQELRDYLARPDRLTAADVQRAAQRALARGEASAAGAPRLQQQLQQLRAQLDQLAVAVPVSINSDNTTRVSLAPLGDLGSFGLRQVQLQPGHYTVVGRRDGFRDVRQEFEIAPGQDTPTLSVECTERI
ncbi:MAG: protein kinase [Pseudomonadota bacterium]